MLGKSNLLILLPIVCFIYGMLQAIQPHSRHTKGDEIAEIFTRVQPSLLPKDTTTKLKKAVEKRLGGAPTIFYHVHKSGGTSMCAGMERSGRPLLPCSDSLLTQDGRRTTTAYNTRLCNCNGPVNPSPIATSNPQETKAYLAKYPWVEVYFNEDGVADEPYFGDQAVQVIVIRNPINRFISHMFHERDAFGLLPEAGLSSKGLIAAVLNHTSGSWSPGSWPLNGGVLDNYITRFLAGYTPLGRPSAAGVHNVSNITPVTRAMFDRAVHNLVSMDAVLLLEDASSLTAGGLLESLGLEAYTTRGGASFSSRVDYAGLDSEAVRRLQELHFWDQMLYSLANARHRQFIMSWAAIEPTL